MRPLSGLSLTFFVVWASGQAEDNSTVKEIITSPNFPNSYPSNLNKDILVEVPPGHSIEVEFLKFELEGGDCQYDSLTIFDGPTRNSPKIGTYCGSQLPPSFESEANTLLFVLITDSSQNRMGFKLEYSQHNLQYLDEIWKQCDGEGPSNLRENKVWRDLFSGVFNDSHWPYLKCLIKKISAFDITSDTKHQILNEALKFGNQSINEGANIILNNTDYLEAKDSRFGRTVLMSKIASGNKDQVKSLLDYGADVNYVDKTSKTPLLLALDRIYDIELIKQLIDKTANISQSYLKDILRSSVYNSDDEKVELAERIIEKLDEPLNIEIPIRRSLELGYSKTVTLFVKNGVNLTSYDIEYAVIDGDDVELINFLIENGYKLSLVDVIRNDRLNDEERLEVAERLIDNIDVDKPVEASRWYEDHVTPLEAAITIGDLKMVKFLVENGNANVNTVDNRTNTPLGLALKSSLQNKRMEIIKTLIDNGAKTNVTMNWVPPITLLEFAVFHGRGNFELIDLLIENGADIHSLSLAELIQNNNLDDDGKVKLVKMMIGNVNIEEPFERNGLTPLQAAVFHKNLKLVKLFVENGANLNAKIQSHPKVSNSLEGYTPLLMAAKSSSASENTTEIAKYLLDSGADVTAKGNDGFNMMNWAIENEKYTNIVELVKFGIVNGTTETQICHYDKYLQSNWCEDLITLATKRRLTDLVSALNSKSTLEEKYLYGENKWQILTSGQLNKIEEEVKELKIANEELNTANEQLKDELFTINEKLTYMIALFTEEYPSDD